MPETDQITPCIVVGEGETKKEVGSSLLELEVQEDHDLAGVFRMKLAIVREADGLWTFLDQDSATPWTPVEIKMNAGDEEEEILKGFVTQIRVHIDTQEGSSYLELTGMDSTGLMSLEEVIKDWPGKSDSDIATEIFGKYNLTADVDATEVVHDDKVSTILQRESDIQFLKRLARRNGFECVVKGDAGLFKRVDLSAGDALPALAAHFAKETNLNSFDANWNLLRPAAVEMHRLDFFTKALESITVIQSSQDLLGQDGPDAVTVPNGVQAKAFLKHSVTTGMEEMEKLANAVADQGQWFIEAKGEVDSTLYGAILHARNRVPIKGVGDLFSGMYYLTSVKHMYTVDRYVQQFTARRNATVSKPDDFGGTSLF